MKIDKLYLSDFRGIHALKLDLDGKSTVLFGVNGVGKSSVLAAINLLYASIINRIVRNRFMQSGSMELKDIKARKASAEIKADFIFAGESEIYPFSRRITYDNRRAGGSGELDKLAAHYEQRYIGDVAVDEDNNVVWKNPDFNIPVFANYGVNRLVLKTPLRIRKKPFYGQYSAFENAIKNQIDFDKLFEWFLEQELDESIKQKSKPNYQDKALKAVKEAMLAMLDDCRDIHIVAKPYSMKITKNGETLDVLQLSDGEKCTLALFGDIARRLAIANPALENPLNGEGVILIDELELHMHTLWQRKVIGILKKTFPNVQFIVTTHSPQILGEIDDCFNIFSLIRTGQEIECTKISSLYGMDSNAVLEDILKTDHISAMVKDKVDQMYREIEEKLFDKAEQSADAIDEITLSRNPDTVRARILIRRGKRIGNA